MSLTDHIIMKHVMQPFHCFVSEGGLQMQNCFGVISEDSDSKVSPSLLPVQTPLWCSKDYNSLNLVWLYMCIWIDYSSFLYPFIHKNKMYSSSWKHAYWYSNKNVCPKDNHLKYIYWYARKNSSVLHEYSLHHFILHCYQNLKL